MEKTTADRHFATVVAKVYFVVDKAYSFAAKVTDITCFGDCDPQTCSAAKDASLAGISEAVVPVVTYPSASLGKGTTGRQLRTVRSALDLAMPLPALLQGRFGDQDQLRQ